MWIEFDLCFKGRTIRNEEITIWNEDQLACRIRKIFPTLINIRFLLEKDSLDGLFVPFKILEIRTFIRLPPFTFLFLFPLTLLRLRKAQWIFMCDLSYSLISSRNPSVLQFLTSGITACFKFHASFLPITAFSSLSVCLIRTEN